MILIDHFLGTFMYTRQQIERLLINKQIGPDLLKRSEYDEDALQEVLKIELDYRMASGVDTDFLYHLQYNRPGSLKFLEKTWLENLDD